MTTVCQGMFELKITSLTGGDEWEYVSVGRNANRLREAESKNG